MTHENTPRPAPCEWIENDLPAMTKLFDTTDGHLPLGEVLTDEPPITTVDKGQPLALRTRAHDRP
ncbi:hypothetical protein [Streptomyces sp. NBC_00827]|uniref:hypothetical protein n=1 Tax=Streptomyces sp. NBC_00827 TaxID=2903677 RepID=UPI00386E2ABC|nr:hypothetical protein OG569_17550 [Streptomyces sp. NBC_00827]